MVGLGNLEANVNPSTDEGDVEEVVEEVVGV